VELTTAAWADWAHPLCLASGGYWQQRVRVSVRNGLAQGAAGSPLTRRTQVA